MNAEWAVKAGYLITNDANGRATTCIASVRGFKARLNFLDSLNMDKPEEVRRENAINFFNNTGVRPIDLLAIVTLRNMRRGITLA